jgi:hypothetical protein
VSPSRRIRRGRCRGPPAIDAVLAVLDEEPTEWEPADRAVVSDDGQAIRAALYREDGKAASVELSPAAAVALAGKLLVAALPRPSWRTEGNSTVCQWCERPFRARRGGSPQRFCGGKCRSAFWTALRHWGERAVAAGILTINDIKSGNPTARTVLARATSSAPASGEAPRSISRQWLLAQRAATPASVISNG